MSEPKYGKEPITDKTCIVVGTRPGIIKMSPIISEIDERDVESFTLHAGQHYSRQLDGRVFDDLGLSQPRHRVEGVKKATHHGEQTAVMLEGIEEILLEEMPENVLVCADANFNLAGALAARKLRLNLGHVEAGLRSNDWRMPEEHNRVMIDHISDYLFVPTLEAYGNAVQDDVKGEVVLTGNTIVDAVERNLEVAREKSTIQKDLEIDKEKYTVLTAHREESVDEREKLKNIIDSISAFINEFEMPVVYPVHPRTDKRLEQFNLTDEINGISDLLLEEPLGYLDFLKLLADAEIALTDSGGIQEEACILQVPCVTLRENSERPETIEVGANTLSGTEPSDVVESAHEMLNRTRNWPNPFGDGDAAVKIVDTILEE